MSKSQHEDDEQQSNGDDGWVKLVYRRHFSEAIDLKAILETLKKEKVTIDVLLDVGCGDSSTAILLASSGVVNEVIGLDLEHSTESIWTNAVSWGQLLGKPVSSRLIEADIFDKKKVLEKLNKKADLAYLHQMLHHLRATYCRWEQQGDLGITCCKLDPENPVCNYNECKKAVGEFDPEVIFTLLDE